MDPEIGLFLSNAPYGRRHGFPDGKRGRVAQPMILVLSGIVTALILAELILRLLGVSYPSFYTADEHTGFTLRPYSRGWWHNEGQAFIRINSQGFRDREHAQAKPLNTLRIAILGDSYGEALQVDMNQTFWTIIERELRDCQAVRGRTVEVMNFSVSGYGTAQELLTWRYRAKGYAPDIVILAFLTGNDVRNNIRALEQDPLRPYFIHRQGQLVLDHSFRDTIGFRLRDSLLMGLYRKLRDRFRVLQVVGEAHHAIQTYREQSRQSRGRMATWQKKAEIHLDEMVYRAPLDPVWQEAWQVTEELIMLLHREVTAEGATLLLVTLSNGIQVHPDARVRQDAMTRLGVDGLFYPDLRLKALGEREGIPVLNLAPSFQRYAEQHHAFLHGFGSHRGYGHWNADGHRLAGEMIAQQLCAGLLAETSEEAAIRKTHQAPQLLDRNAKD